ncbi:MAG: MarR family transcriptional regulator [Anaerolineales bacterium]|nr:MarR family transcriptional regulator [Anaerolineales bacterium]
MNVTFYRSRRPGPELEIEDSLVQHADKMFSKTNYTQWVGGALTIGTAVPDLLVVSYRPEVISLSNISPACTAILAYLRFYGKASMHVMARKLRLPQPSIGRELENLVGLGVVYQRKRSFIMKRYWFDVLPRVRAIEAKTENWRRAVWQANRNQLFATESYVALPHKLAERVKSHQSFAELGIGLIGIKGTGETEFLKQAKRVTPKIWQYYYRLASYVANDLGKDAIYSSN